MLPAGADVADRAGVLSATEAARRFARAMAAIGDFESRPHLAVAVSGGADSMALCHLARDWAASRGGRVTALTVDHRLRPDSAAEAARVGDWMRSAGIDHHVLAWMGPKPQAGIQQAARDARYRLLCGWCRAASVLHLLLAHHRCDQAETVLHRLLRASGTTGLSGMARIVEAGAVRLLRPVLDWSPAGLRAFLSERRLDWLEDPSNRDQRFARARLRAAAPTLAAAGVTTEALLALAADASAARSAMAGAAVALAVAACRLHPAGFVRVDRQVWSAAPANVAAAALARLLAAVGGGERPPPISRVATLVEALSCGVVRSATLGRCRIIDATGGFWLFRECRALPPERPLVEEEDDAWDGRFRLICHPAGSLARFAVRVRPYRVGDAAILRAGAESTRFDAIPHLARITLPILCDESGPALAPLLGYARRGSSTFRGMLVQTIWNPRHGIAEPGCFQSLASSHII